jgi:hypothetical protein
MLRRFQGGRGYVVSIALARDRDHVFSTGPSQSVESPLWKTVGSWEIRVDKTLNFGCFMMASYVRGTFVRIGLNQKHLNGYILVGNNDWRSLEIGKEYELVLQLDGNPPWRGNATALQVGGSGPASLYLPFLKPDFMIELAKKQMLSIWYEAKLITSLSLTGSFAATQELVLCQRSIEAARGGGSPADPFVRDNKPRDPFARGEPPVSSDPFAR